MRIQFELPTYNIITKSFCNLIVKRIRKDIRKKTNLASLQIRIDTMLSDNFIDWMETPKQLSAKYVFELIMRNICWKKIRNRYIIHINPEAILPNSNTTLALVAKYLNYGTERTRGCYFISNVFMRYQENIYRYWALYRMKLQR